MPLQYIVIILIGKYRLVEDYIREIWKQDI